MANTLITPTAVTRESLRVLHQKLNFITNVTRDYDDRFAQDGAKIGDTVKIRQPNQYTVSTGAALSAQDTTESTVDLKITTQKHVDLSFTSQDLTLSIDEFSDRYIDPAMSVLAANIEADALNMFKDVNQQINNQGSAATFAKFLLGRKKLVDALAPVNDRCVILNTQDNVDMVDALKGLFNDQKALSKQYKEGMLGRTAGFDFYENTLIPAFTPGGWNGAYTTDTRTSALATDGTAYATITVAAGSGTMVVGDVFTIANVFRVHPETKVSTGVLHQFVVTAANAGGAGSVAISPSIVLGGAKQNCTIPSTAASAAITFAGTASTAHGVSLAFQKGAFAFATADLIMPKGVDFAARDNQDGIAMRVVRQYDINSDKMPCRIDVLYGYKTLRPQLATRIANN
jgi:hypothetical protein